MSNTTTSTKVCYWRAVRIGAKMQGHNATSLNSPDAMTYDQFAAMVKAILHVVVVDGKYSFGEASYKIVEWR